MELRTYEYLWKFPSSVGFVLSFCLYNFLENATWLEMRKKLCIFIPSFTNSQLGYWLFVDTQTSIKMTIRLNTILWTLRWHSLQYASLPAIQCKSVITLYTKIDNNFRRSIITVSITYSRTTASLRHCMESITENNFGVFCFHIRMKIEQNT